MSGLLPVLIGVDRPEWMDTGACQNAPLDFVPDRETDSGLRKARVWCNLCPVRPACLDWAIQQRCEGYWGGTSTYQRKQLVRVRTRAKCPLCHCVELVVTDRHELCLACGISWIRDVRLEPIAATPLPQTATQSAGSPEPAATPQPTATPDPPAEDQPPHPGLLPTTPAAAPRTPAAA